VNKLSGRHLMLVFTGLMIGNTMAGLDATIVATAGPTIVADLGSQRLMPWVFTAYQLAQIALMPLYGKLGDLFGRKRVFAFAVGMFVAGSMLCGAAPSMGLFLTARALQGAGAGGLTGLSMAIVADITPAESLGRYLGYAGLVFAVTSIVGPLAGGLFVDHLSWRWAFYVNVPSAVVCLLALRFVPAIGAARRARVDWFGAALLAGGATAAVLALSWGGVQYAWSSTAIRLLAVSAVVVFAGFVAWQQRAAEPLLPLRVFARREVSVAVFANLVAGIGFFGVIVYMPVYFQAVAAKGATASGLLLIPSAISTALCTTLVGSALGRIGGAKVFPLIGMFSMAIGFAVLSGIRPSTPLGIALMGSVLVGVGVGFVMQVMLFVVQRAVSGDDLGAATAVTVLARIVGGVVGVAVLGNVFNRRLASEVRRRAPGLSPARLHGDPQSIRALPPALRHQVVLSFGRALSLTFFTAIPVMLLGLLVMAALPGAVARAVRAAPTPARAAPEPL
jgi:EmrB/QacA subfamily drug resistance transporter